MPTSASEPPAVPPERRFTDRLRKPETVIAPGIRLKGSLTGDDSVEIGGSIEGPVEINGLCQVRESGAAKGSISATYLIIEGRAQGRLRAMRKVELGAKAHVEADIRAAGVAIAEGCFFDGRIHMEAGTPGEAHHPFKEKRGGQADTPD